MSIKIAMIGGGNMATALIQGIRANSAIQSQIVVYDPNPDNVERFTNQGIPAFVEYHESLLQADIWVLAMKPQQIAMALQDLRPWYQHNPIVLSIAAGIPISALAYGLRGAAEQIKLVRAMPNTPALVGQGATGIYATQSLSESEKNLIETLLASVGVVVWVPDEPQLDAVTALSGSGPAYVFLFLEALVQGGQKLGLSKEVAEQLALATVKGSAILASQSELSLQDLRAQVTSKGGTTAAAIASFEQQQLVPAVGQAMQAAYQRAQELAQLVEK